MGFIISVLLNHIFVSCLFQDFQEHIPIICQGIPVYENNLIWQFSWAVFSTDPTQKMPRALSTSASLFRSLLHKTELMGLSTESQPLHSTSVGDIRKKWHIPPAFKWVFCVWYFPFYFPRQSLQSWLAYVFIINL